MQRRIASFRGPYAFLSNFHVAPIVIPENPVFPVYLRGKTARTNEHAFQAAKFTDPDMGDPILNAPSPTGAKRLGKRHGLRSDWHQIRLGVMWVCVVAKFIQHPDLAKKLLATNTAYLEEGNTWGDTFWGTCNGTGDNHLGLLLMEMRDFLSAKQPEPIGDLI